MTDSGRPSTDIQQIVERLLRLQEENRRKIRPGEAKSAPSTPTSEQRIATRSLSRHDTFIASRRNHPEHLPTHLATPTHNPYLHPLPAHCPSPQSYQPMEIKGTNFKNNRNGLKYLSRSTPSMSPSGSPHHSDSESGPIRISRKTKKFLRQFRNVPSAEKVIKYYACAIVSDILLQGTLYITENYFAFYSNIFGYVNRTLIPIVNVCKIQKEKTAKFIPNAVGIQTFDGQTFVFSSLISRHATYKFMIHMWRKSRNLTDKDIEATIPGVTEEICLDESGSNSADSTLEDCLGLPATNHIKPSIAHQNATSWSKSSPLIVPADFPVETNVSYAENISNVTPESCISTASYNEVRNTIEVVGTSAIETELTSSQPKENFCRKVHRSNSKYASNPEGKMQWIIKTEVVKSAVNIGIAPFRAVKETLREFTVLPKSSLLKFMSSSLIVCLLVSAAFMVYRVESLNDRLKSNTFQYGDLYEEVLEMQQKLHAATAQEIEKTLSHQLSQLVTVKESLEALIFLLNPDHNSAKSHIQETTY